MTMNDQFRAVVRADGAAAWVDIEGEVDLGSVTRLRDAVTEALSHGPELLYLDMSRVTFIDSSGLAVLSRAQRQAESGGYRLVIHAPARAVRRVLELSGLDRHIAIETGE